MSGVQPCVVARYKRALEEAKELQSNISKAKQSAAARRKRRAKDLLEKARDDGGAGGNEERLQATKAALARVSTFTPEVIESRLKVCHGSRETCPQLDSEAAADLDVHGTVAGVSKSLDRLVSCCSVYNISFSPST